MYRGINFARYTVSFVNISDVLRFLIVIIMNIYWRQSNCGALKGLFWSFALTYKQALTHTLVCLIKYHGAPRILVVEAALASNGIWVHQILNLLKSFNLLNLGFSGIQPREHLFRVKFLFPRRILLDFWDRIGALSFKFLRIWRLVLFLFAARWLRSLPAARLHKFIYKKWILHRFEFKQTNWIFLLSASVTEMLLSLCPHCYVRTFR